MANKRFSIEAVFKAVDKMTAPVTRMQNRMQKFTRGFSRGLTGVNNSLNKMTKGIRTGATRAMAGLTVIATGLFLSMKGVAETADALAKQSRRLDWPIEDLQEWVFISSQAGVSQELFNNSLGAFSKRLGEAKAGQGPLVSGLKKANPELLKQLVATESISDAFDIMVGAMRNAETATGKALIANAAFSRSGLAMVDISKLSANKINELREEQRENGVITMESAASAEAYNDAMDSLKRSLTGFVQGVLLPLAPMMTEIVKTTREWVVTNRELVASNVLEFGRNLVENFGTVVTWLKRIGVAVAVLFTLNAVLGAFVGIMTAVNIVMSMNPIGLWIWGITLATAALVGLVAVIVKNWEPIVQIFADIWNKIVDTFFKGVELIKTLFFEYSPLGIIIKNWEPITDFFGNMWENIINNATAGMNVMVDRVLAVRDKIANILSSLGGGVAEFFGFGDDDPSTPGASVSSGNRSEVVSTNNSTTTHKSEVTIKDETGRAVQTVNTPMGAATIRVQPSGAF